MKPSPDLALAVMTAWQWRQYGLLPAKEGGGRKRARHRGQTTDAAWKQAADRARPGDSGDACEGPARDATEVWVARGYGASGSEWRGGRS